MPWVIGTIACLISAGLAVLLTYLLADRRSRAQLASARTEQALAQQRCQELERQLLAEKAAADQFREQLLMRERTLTETATQLQAARENIAEQRKLLEDAHTQLKQAFATVSSEALTKNTETFLQLAQQRFETLAKQADGSLEAKRAQIDALLKPLREVLDQYQKRLSDIEKARQESYGLLREQLGTLLETQRALNTNTTQLVTALRRPQTRGQWGEITLRRLIELAGMNQRCDFTEQLSVDSEEGRLRPDVVVHLPGGRTIIIDCKTVLDAFLDAASAPDEEQRKAHLQRHCQQVRNRARELSARAYWNQFKQSPEYVVMFLPGEAFLYAAVELDPAVVEDCLKNRVVVATPTTLMALLKAVEFGWRQEAIAENAEEIRKQGRDLYDRIVTLAAHFQRLGSSLQSTVSVYNAAVGSLESRVLVTARRIGEMGVRTEKEIPDLSPVDVQPRELTAIKPPESVNPVDMAGNL